MNILYVSSLSSHRLVDIIQAKTDRDPGFAVQKFNRLIVKGLTTNGVNVTVFSNPPVNSVVGVSWVSIPKEEEDGITYHYAKYFNISIIKDICVVLNTLYKTIKWGLHNRKQKIIICDALSISASLGALVAGKLLGIKILGVLTDMPGLMVPASSVSKKRNKIAFGYIYSAINKPLLYSYTYYVFLTKQMNSVINKHNKPYIIMEGLCDNTILDARLDSSTKAEPKILMYAGGLHEKYGLKMLVEGFRKIDRDDIRLVIYGSGPFAKDLQVISQQDSRIEYRGVVSNDIVMKTEFESTLLINPRPTNEEFTKYSFPSKNIEYMASGTPLLTTKLPGMPTEYYPYVYLIDDESVDGCKNAIENILNNDMNDLTIKGVQARDYILLNKNNKVQTQRIINLING